MVQTTRRTELGPHFTEGARLLWEEVRIRGMSQGEAGRSVGAHNGQFNRWLYGLKKPGIHFALAIERVFGVPVIAWTQEPTQDFVPMALAG